MLFLLQLLINQRQTIFCLWAALLDQLKEAGTSASGDSQLSEDLAKLLDEAERMVDEMALRNLNPQKTAAEKERDEAKKRKAKLQQSEKLSAFALIQSQRCGQLSSNESWIVTVLEIAFANIQNTSR